MSHVRLFIRPCMYLMSDQMVFVCVLIHKTSQANGGRTFILTRPRGYNLFGVSSVLKRTDLGAAFTTCTLIYWLLALCGFFFFFLFPYLSGNKQKTRCPWRSMSRPVGERLTCPGERLPPSEPVICFLSSQESCLRAATYMIRHRPPPQSALAPPTVCVCTLSSCRHVRIHSCLCALPNESCNLNKN